MIERAKLAAALIACAVLQASSEYFQIRIVDGATGRGVPLVELRTTNKISHWTDSNGIVAWNEPGLMDRDVYFEIQSPGYAFPGGGRTIKTTRGGKVELKITRLQPAERLYRVTGQGLYRDSVLTGHATPVREPLLNGMVMGQDTVRAVVYRGEVFWLWGDTDRPNGPLGNFNTTAATSRLPGKGGLDPEIGVDLFYFTRQDGFVKPMIPWTKRMTWMHSLMVVRDPVGRERLIAYYEVMRKLGDAERAGLAVFNDEKREFDPLVEFPVAPTVPLHSNAFRVAVGADEYFYFTGLPPGSGARVRAVWDAVQNLAAYEHLAVEQGVTVWKRGLPVLAPAARGHFTDMQTGDSFEANCDGVAWNAHRQRWIATLQRNPGEVWYAEADTPIGPWAYATPIAVHGRYTFYWPVPHPFFDQKGGRFVYFEGTYTSAFSGNPVITPRYDYNQIMYRVDLDDPRLFLPAPVYRLRDGRYQMREAVAAENTWNEIESLPFYALSPGRRRPGAVAVGGFYALPLAGEPEPDSAEGDWQCTTNDNTPFTLGITGQGRIRIEVLGEVFTTGAYRDGRLSAEVNDKGTRYRLNGVYRDGKVTGSWNEDGGGTFSCLRAPGDKWRESRALVPLYLVNGRYTTEAAPGLRPIARVWRNDAPILAMERRSTTGWEEKKAAR